MERTARHLLLAGRRMGEKGAVGNHRTGTLETAPIAQAGPGVRMTEGPGHTGTTADCAVADVNGDGKLSATVLLAQPMTDVPFCQLDRTHDRVMSGDELQAAHGVSGAQGSFGSYPQDGTALAGAKGTQDHGNAASGN